MEYIAKIVKEERIKKQFWKYTFLDIRTGKTDWFLNNYSIPYIHGLIGKLKLEWSEKRQCWLYQNFNQNISDLKETVKEEELGLWEKSFEKEIGGIEEKITRRPTKLFKTHEELVEFLNGLHEMDKNWKKVAARFKRTDRTLRRIRKKPILSLQKAGPKFKIDRKSFYHLIHSIQAEEAKTLKEASNYVLNKTGLWLSKTTTHRILKKAGYSHHGIHYRNPKQKQNLAETLDFMEEVSKLPQHLILATDESGYPLNLAPKKGWGIKGQKITRFKKHYSPNYSLILLIRNTSKGGITYWELVKGAVNTDIFVNFINNIKLPTNERYHLLIDRLSAHKTKKVREALDKKDMEPRFIVSANPWLNPTELVFNVIKGYVKSYEPKSEEELRRVITDKLNILNEKDLTVYFKDCLDFDFILKSGH